MFSKPWNPRWASSTATDPVQVARGRLRTGPHATTSVGGPDRRRAPRKRNQGRIA